MSSDRSTPPHRKRRSALSQPLFRRYFGGSCFSTMGTWITRFLFGWSAWDLTHSALWVGVVSALMLLPTFLLSPIFGVVSDRIKARDGLLVTMSSQGVMASVAALAELWGWFSLTWLLCLASVAGAIMAAHQPIRLALIPQLIPRDSLPSAIGISAMVFNTSRILGPAVGGWLITHVSTAAAFLTAACCFATAVLFLLCVRGLPRPFRHTHASVSSELRDGLVFIKGHRGIKLVLAFTLVNGLLGRTVIELLPALSGQLLAGDARTLATLTATAGAGSIIGGFILARQHGNEHRLVRLVAGCLFTGAVALLPIYLVGGLAGLCGIVMYLSMTTTMVGTGCQALAQLLVEDRFRGRVLSIWTVVTMGTPAFGAFFMGAAADLTGFPPVLTGFALAGGLVAIVLHRKRHWVTHE